MKNFMSPNHSPYPENPNKSSFNSYGDNPWNEIPNSNLSDPWWENQNFQNQPNHDPWGENDKPYPEDSWSEYPNDSSFNLYHENPWPNNLDNSSSNLYEHDHCSTPPNQYPDDSWTENFITAPSYQTQEEPSKCLLQNVMPEAIIVDQEEFVKTLLRLRIITDDESTDEDTEDERDLLIPVEDDIDDDEAVNAEIKIKPSDEIPNPQQSQPKPNEEVTLSSIEQTLKDFITSQQTTNDRIFSFINSQQNTTDRIFTKFDHIRSNMEQGQQNQQASINDLEKKLDRLSNVNRPTGTLPSNTQQNTRPTVSQLAAGPSNSNKKYQPPHARNKQVNVISTRGGNIYGTNVKIAGPADSEKVVPKPVVDEVDDDDDNESVDEEIEMEPVEDDDELEKHFQDLLSSDLGEAENNHRDITAEELEKILEMSTDEFKQWLEKAPLDESYEELKRKDKLMLTTSFEELPTHVESKQLQGEFLVPVVILQLVSIQIQVISVITILSTAVRLYNEVVSRKRKLKEASTAFLTDKCSNFEKIKSNRWVMTKVKFSVFSPIHFRPPDISSVKMYENSPLVYEKLENVHITFAHNDLGNILKKNFLRKFIQPYDALWNKMGIESELLKHAFSKKNIFKDLTIAFSNDRFSLHFQKKKLKSMVYHMLRPPNYNNILYHLRFRKLLINGTQHNYQPQWNSCVGEGPIEPDK